MIPLSVLDLSVVTTGTKPAAALRNSIDLARHVDGLGFVRYWLAEHHNLASVASPAPDLMIGQIAAVTKNIRVGSGGVMLPNHAPLVVAERFKMLEALFPGRIDLGLGRAPGTDMATAQALRRTLAGDVDRRFPQDVIELIHYLEPAEPGQAVRAVPGEGTRIPIWILGSSLFGAQLAAMLGLPFAFASHFAPAQLSEAVQIYRERFEPSDRLSEPYLMLGLNLVAADTDEAARRLFTSTELGFLNLRTGRTTRMQPPVDDIAERYAAVGLDIHEGPISRAVVGSPESVRLGLERFNARHQPNEVIVSGQIFDFGARVRSLEILAEIARAA